MFQKMVVGYDGSEESRAALQKAVSFMQLSPNTQLVVAYVNEDVLGGGDIAYAEEPFGSSHVLTDMTTMTPSTSDYDSPRYFAREYANQMSNSIQDQLDNYQIKATIIAIDGHPTKALSELAEKEHADVIIVGNSGKSGFQKFFVGSVSEKLITESPCSVLVVK
jgi:nucleotide-binding universal stress UspA family protein